MKKSLTNLARIVICLMGAAVIAVCAIWMPEMAREEAVGKPTPPIVWPFFAAAWTLSVPIFVSLYQAYKITNYVDNNTAFSVKTIKSLQKIKISAIVFAGLIVLGTAAILYISSITNPTDDTPPFMMFGFIFTTVPCVIATFTAVLQRILRDAIGIKSENDSII